MLNEKQKDLVKATVPVLKENGEALTDYFYKRMLKNNPGLKETFNMGHQRSGAQAKALAGAVLAYAENIDNPAVLLPVIELICNKHVSLNIQSPDYDIVGENLLHSISEVLSIPMDDELITAWGAAYKQLADIFISTENQLYDERKQSPGSWTGWRNFIVDKKVKESEEITSFYLVPQDAQPLPAYKPGQYITLRVLVPALGIKQPRQYSLSSSPADNYLRISVKREDARTEGMISMVNHLLAEHADPNFKPALREGINAGTREYRALKKEIYFIHAARSSEVHALRKELKNLASQNDNLHVFIAYENVKEDEVPGKDYQVKGRLDLNALPAAYLPAEADYYLCGPVPFMQEQYRSLISLGVPEEKIFSEAFGTGGLHL